MCLFGVVLGGLNLTAVYKPSFYGFVLPALVPLIVRVAMEGDPVHLYTASGDRRWCSVFVRRAFGHRLNDVLTHSLAIRYANLDLIGELKDQTRAAVESARAAAEAGQSRARASCSRRRATTCASRCMRWGCTPPRCAPAPATATVARSWP